MTQTGLRAGPSEKNLLFYLSLDVDKTSKNKTAYFQFYVLQFWYLVDLSEARGCFTNSFVINWIITWRFDKTYLWRRHALLIEDCAFSPKIDYTTRCRTFQFSKGIQIALLVQKLWRFCCVSGFCLLVELHREGLRLQPAQQACYLSMTHFNFLFLGCVVTHIWQII